MTRKLRTSLDTTLRRALKLPTGGQSGKDTDYYARKAYAENTYRSYRNALLDFVRWAGISDPFPTTADVLCQYLVDRAETLSPSTLEHRLAALSFVHRLLGFLDPARDERIKPVLRGIKKDRLEQGWTPEQAPAFTLQQLMCLIRAMGDSLSDRRDKAFFLIGLFGAFRQSELTSLSLPQLSFVDQGVVIRMGATKGDQLIETARFKAIPKGKGSICPVSALKSWLHKAQLTEGAVFRGIDRHGNIYEKPISHTTANRIIKQWVSRAGIGDANKYSGHSLRASFITIARELKVPDFRIAKQSHHRDLRVIETYYRPEMSFELNPASDVMKALERT